MSSLPRRRQVPPIATWAKLTEL